MTTQAAPLGLEDPAAYIPTDNPQTAKKIESWGGFCFDKRLSKTNTVGGTATCLDWCSPTDKPSPMGNQSTAGWSERPTAINRVYSKVQFWDGRAQTLEDNRPGRSSIRFEHGFLDYDEMTAKDEKISGYRKLFEEVFPTRLPRRISARRSPVFNGR